MTKKAVDQLRRRQAPQQAPLPDARPKALVYLLTIFVLAIAAYANTFHAPFVLDDHPEIVRNVIIKDMDNFLSNARGYDYNPRRFVGYLSFGLNYALHGLDVRGFHAVNLAIHIINAALLYLFVVITFKTPRLRKSSLAPKADLIAFAAALLFAVHPIQTQAVTYIVQRFTSLAALFFLLSLVLYGSLRLKLEQEGRFTARTLLLYLLAVCAAFLGMKTKEITFTLPLMVALYETCFFQAGFRRGLVLLAPMLLTLVVIPLSLLDVSQPLSAVLSDATVVTKVETGMTRGDYLITQIVVVIRYIGLLFLPVNQNLDYDQPIYNSVLNPVVLICLLALLTLLSAAVYFFVQARKGNGEGKPLLGLAAFGILWFFITLSVESSIIPIADVMFEHRVYLPSVGFFLASMTALFSVWQRLSLKGSLAAARTIIPLIIVFALLLSAATVLRNSIWSDDIRLWEDVVKKSPRKARTYVGLGASYEERGRFDEAIEAYETALKLDPRYPRSYGNLGLLYEKKGRADDAMRLYLAALQLDPEYMDAYNNLGILYGKQGHFDAALSSFQTAFRLDPARSTPHTNLGILYMRQGMREQAFAEFDHALRLNPDDGAAHYNLGIAYEELGRPESAAAAYAAAIQRTPTLFDAYNNLAILYAKRGDLDRAILTLEAALQHRANDPNILQNLENARRLRRTSRLR